MARSDEAAVALLTARDVRNAYARYARAYDLLFGAVLDGGRRAALKALPSRRGAKVLEVGVGTGLSLPHYGAGVQVTGVDLSPDMLALARKVRSPARVGLAVMDAGRLSFPAGRFDASVAMYVATVTPDPGAMLREMCRVTKAGGRVVVVAHFSRRGHWTSWGERCLAPLGRFLGWRPLFYLDDFLALLPPGKVQVSACGLFGYWRLIVLQRPRRRA